MREDSPCDASGALTIPALPMSHHRVSIVTTIVDASAHSDYFLIVLVGEALFPARYEGHSVGRRLVVISVPGRRHSQPRKPFRMGPHAPGIRLTNRARSPTSQTCTLTPAVHAQRQTGRLILLEHCSTRRITRFFRRKQQITRQMTHLAH